jgi:protein gp37
MTRRLTGVAYGKVGEPLASKPLLDQKALWLPESWRKPRRIFVCSMTDLFGEFVSVSWIDSIFSVMSQTPWHTYQVLTKRAQRMAKYCSQLYSIPENVWLGVTIESPEYSWRADYLRDLDASVRWISAEPLIGNVASTLDLSNISWLVAGAESGHGARPCDLDWVRHLRDGCQLMKTKFFYKQAAVNGHKIPTPELDGQVWTEMPDLAVTA